MAAALDDDRDAFGAARQAEAADRKLWRSQQKEAPDEMLPKASGRHAHMLMLLGNARMTRQAPSAWQL
jgi:hypothetical protein